VVANAEDEVPTKINKKKKGQILASKNFLNGKESIYYINTQKHWY